MKKLLLFSLVIGFALSTVAQYEMAIRKNQKRVKGGQEVAVKQTQKIPARVFNENKGVDEDVDRVYVGMAASQRGLRREEAHMISYNYELNVISVTDVLDPETYPNVDEYGIIGMWYSTDYGQTWNGPVILNDDIEVYPNWYIAGALYNPEGNTVVDDMFGVGQGVLNMGGGDWNTKTFGSATLAGNFQTNYSEQGVGDDGYWNIYGLGQIGNDMRCLNMVPEGPWTVYTGFEFQPIVGEFDGEVFDWDFSNLIEANLFTDSEGVIEWIGQWQGYDSGCEIAWADDGEIGYMWMVGVSDEDATGWQPFVFRTDDAGDSWDYVYLDFFDGDIQDILEEYMNESYGGFIIPRVFESAGIVDINGDLQMIIASDCYASDVVTYPDSLGSPFVWTYPGDLYNVSVNGDGISGLMWVDSLRTDNPVNATQGN